MKNKYVWVILISILGLFCILILYSILSPRDRELRTLKAAMDVDNPITRKFTLSLASKYPGEYNIDQVCQIYSYIYKNWKYVSDPHGLDYFAKASESISNNLSGDCDDFAILIATSIESIGGKTRINLAYDINTRTGHAFTEVYFNNDPKIIEDRINYHFQNILQVLFQINRVKEINYNKDDRKGIWLNLDWTSKYPGGPYYKYTKRDIFYPRLNYYVTETTP